MKPEPLDIYFLHIPKTAGSSLATFLRAAYPMEQCLLVHTWDKLVRMNRDEIQSYRCYTGHFGTGLYSLLDRDIPTVTLLRDPFERSISHIRHGERYLSRNRLRRMDWTIKQMLGRSLRDEWVKPPTSDIMGNFQTRSLGVEVDLNPLLGRPKPREFGYLLCEAQSDQSMDQILERAKRRLDGMAVVGTVERFDETFGLLCDHLNIARPETLPEENVSPGHAVRSRYRTSGEYTPEFIQGIDAMNEYDRELYAYADRLLDKRLASRGLRNCAEI